MPMLPESQVGCPVAEAASRRPDDPALSGPTGGLTYAALDRQIAAAAALLARKGVRAGERVALLGQNSPEMIVAVWALLRLGAVSCPLSTRLPERVVLERKVLLGAELLLCDEPFAAWPGRTLPLASLMEAAPAPGRANALLDVERHATVIYTSGSTGAPRAAVLTARNLLASAAGSNLNLPLQRGDRWMLSLPLYHVGGLGILLRCALAGACVVLPSPDVSTHVQVSEAAATHVSFVTTQLLRLLEGNGPLPETLRGVLLGGSAFSAGILEAAHARGLPILTSYGCTEMASQVTTTQPGADLSGLLTSGRPLAHRKVRLGADGRIHLSGDTLFAGYMDRGEINPCRDEDGWFATGDVGEWAPKGLLRVLGRVDNLFISGGENVQPEAIEGVIERVNGILRAVVVPVPDRAFGYRPVAFVEARGAELPVKAIQATLDHDLPRFMHPVAFLELPPADGSMKLNRAGLQRLATQQLGGCSAAL